VVGADHVRASVHVEYELGTSEDTSETYDPKTPATLTQEHSEENSTGGASAGVPGTASNVPSGTPTATAAPAAEQSNSRNDATTYAVSKVLHHKVEPAGSVRRIAAAVLVDDAVEIADQAGKQVTTRRKRTAEEMKMIEQLASAAIGVDAQRGDVLAVENLSFQEAPGEIILPQSKTDRIRHVIEPWSWTLRYLGIAALFGVVYWLVLRPVKRQAQNAFRELSEKLATGLTLAPAQGGVLGTGESAVIEAGGKRATELKKLLMDKVKAEPEVASRLVENWVRQDGRK
jgi:flagellar M-ring protein FliF